MQDSPWHDECATNPLRGAPGAEAPTELTSEQLRWVAGGLNPQPLPPGRAPRFD
jgi:hypothetical protein